MEIITILSTQILMMFIMMLVGFLSYRAKIVCEIAASYFSDLLLKVVTPCIIIKAFNVEFSIVKLNNIMIMFLLSVISIGIGILVSKILSVDLKVEKFGIIFSNIGFMGIPLVTSLLGQEYLLYLSVYIMVFTILLWTYGVYIFSEDITQLKIKNLLLNPAIISVIVGLIIFLLNIDFPFIIDDVLSSFTDINTPLSMFVLGIYLAKESIFKLLKSFKPFYYSFLRLVLVPSIVILVLNFVPNEYLMLKIITLIASSSPCAAAVPIFAQKFNKDFALGARIVSISTLLSLITIPLIVQSAVYIWL